MSINKNIVVTNLKYDKYLGLESFSHLPFVCAISILFLDCITQAIS